MISQLVASEFPEVASLALRALNNISDNCMFFFLFKFINYYYSFKILFIYYLVAVTQIKIAEGSALSNLVDIIRQSEDLDDSYIRNTTLEILTSITSNGTFLKLLIVTFHYFFHYFYYYYLLLLFYLLLFVIIICLLLCLEQVAKALVEEFKLVNVLWTVLQEWLEKNSWETEDAEEESEEGLEAEKPFPISASLLLVHIANKGTPLIIINILLIIH